MFALIAIPVLHTSAKAQNYSRRVAAQAQSQIKSELVNGVVGHAAFKLKSAAHNKSNLVLFGADQPLAIGDGKSVGMPMTIKLSFGTKPMIAPNKQYSFNTSGVWQGNAPMIGANTVQKGNASNDVFGHYDLKLQFYDLKNGLLPGYITLTSSQLNGINVKGFFYAAEKTDPTNPQ